MSTGTDIIQQALEEIAGHSVAAPASPEDIVRGVKKLNSMLQLWEDENIFLNATPIDAPGDEVNEPMSTTNGIANNLALYLSPSKGSGKRVVSKELKDNARRDFNKIKSIYKVVTIPDKVVSSTLPKGAGNRQYGGWSETFFAKGETLTETP